MEKLQNWGHKLPFKIIYLMKYCRMGFISPLFWFPPFLPNDNRQVEFKTRANWHSHRECTTCIVYIGTGWIQNRYKQNLSKREQNKDWGNVLRFTVKYIFNISLFMIPYILQHYMT